MGVFFGMVKLLTIKRSLGLVLIVCLLLASVPVQAANRIYFTSQPDEILIFLNNVAFVKDRISIPSGVDVAVTLPSQIFVDTLVLREGGERVNQYRIQTVGGNPVVLWKSVAAAGELREVTLDYLMSGISWQPKYDMWLTKDQPDSAVLDFYAEISNPVLSLEAVTTTLAAGRVDTSKPIGTQSTVSLNQYIAGYESPSAGQLMVGAVDIQTIYSIGKLDALVGETVYTRLEGAALPARRVLLWNAQGERQVTIIYKVRNQTRLPLAEGIVRTYENGIFLGSDPIEFTPVNGEGSVTVGALQGLRVNRNTTETTLSGWTDRRSTHVELTVSNFNADPVEIEIVDAYPASAMRFSFSLEAEQQIGNLLRWRVTLQAGESLTITYQYDHNY